MTSKVVPQQRGVEMRRHRRYQMPNRLYLAALIALAEGAIAAVSVVVIAILAGVASTALAPANLVLAALSGLAYGMASLISAASFLANPRPRRPVLLESFVSWLLAFALGLAAIFMLDLEHSAQRSGLLATFAVVGVILMGLRGAMFMQVLAMMSRGQLQMERIGVAGATEDVINYLVNGQVWRHGAQPVKTLQLGADEAATLTEESEILTRFVEDCIARNCEQVVFVGDMNDMATMSRIVQACRRYALNVVFAPATRRNDMQYLDVVPLGPNNSVRVLNKPLGHAGLAAKRMFDIFGAAMGLLLLSPFLLMAAILIKLDSPGPVFFRQERMGFNGKAFSILKFRSMSVMEDGRSMRQVERNDPRITRIGKLLRSSSIDELPQLINVLMGQMSLVGPRPHAVSHDATMARQLSQYAHRQRIKPGITGWAQVNGFRGDTSTFERIEGRVLHDLYYIDNWSMLFDVWIIMLTAFSPRTRQNAN